MADVAICYSSDGEAAAGLLAAALAHAGYSIWSEERSNVPIEDRIGDVRAAIVIWSELSRESDWIRAEANYARGQDKLIQASVDDRPPPMPFDPNAVAPLAGWCGGPDHDGWRRILARVEAQCRARPQAAAAAPAAAPARTQAPRGRGLVPAVAVLLALAVIASAFFWMRSGPPYGADSPPSKEEANRPPVASARPPEPVPSVLLDEPILQVEQFGADEAPAEAARSEPPTAAPPSRPSGPRINRRNAENMRLFCQGAGRGTPQCRTFERQLREQS